jgi:signal transduction histidine kinase
MRILKGLSIRQKIFSIILVVTIISIITGFTIEIFSAIHTSRNDLERSISLDAKLIGDYLTPTYLFDDKKGANNILQKLTNIPSVILGATYDSTGNLYAIYNSTIKPGAYNSLPDILKLAEDRNVMLVKESIISNKEVLGTLVLVASTNIIKTKTAEHIKLVLIILVVSILLAILLAYWLERFISGPILKLAAVTRTIRETLDYSVRVKKEANDETGILYDGFNEMLESIDARRKERDIAQQKLQEERENLERRVIERTSELNAAKEKAEESDKLKSAFLANMSHEIRTPLNAILGFIELLNDPALDLQTRQEYSKLINSSGKDLLNLINDILDLARIESNQLKLEYANCNVNELVNEIYTVFSQSVLRDFPTSEVKSILKIPDRAVDYILFTDRLRLKQILTNILNNAKKFTHKGFIEFGFYADEKNENLIFYVKDTGIGIPKDKTELIFQRFAKVADIKEKLYSGTGLGLSIAINLLTLLKGGIRVESELNKGSIFYIHIPLSETSSIPETQGKHIKLHTSKKQFAGKTILIAEDVEWNWQYLEVILKKQFDVKLLWAKDGKEAVEICQEVLTVDLILMDIQMPEIDGLNATMLIKKDYPDIPVIAQTAYASPAIIQACLDAGCNDILIKPLNKNELFLKVEEWLSKI